MANGIRFAAGNFLCYGEFLEAPGFSRMSCRNCPRLLMASVTSAESIDRNDGDEKAKISPMDFPRASEFLFLTLSTHIISESAVY